MNELVNAFKQFIYRDFIYILGGSLVMISFLYLFDQFCLWDMPIPYYILWAGLAYVIGYTIQDIFGLLHLVPSPIHFEPCCFVKWLYRQFEWDEWQYVPKFDWYNVTIEIDAKASERSWAQLERIVALRQIGTTMGPCALVAFGPLIYRFFQTKSTLDLTLVIFILALGVFQIFLSWLKAVQHMKYTYELHKKLNSSAGKK